MHVNASETSLETSSRISVQGTSPMAMKFGYQPRSLPFRFLKTTGMGRLSSQVKQRQARSKVICGGSAGRLKNPVETGSNNKFRLRFISSRWAGMQHAKRGGIDKIKSPIGPRNDDPSEDAARESQIRICARSRTGKHTNR